MRRGNAASSSTRPRLRPVAAAPEELARNVPRWRAEPPPPSLSVRWTLPRPPAHGPRRGEPRAIVWSRRTPDASGMPSACAEAWSDLARLGLLLPRRVGWGGADAWCRRMLARLVGEREAGAESPAQDEQRREAMPLRERTPSTWPTTWNGRGGVGRRSWRSTAGNAGTRGDLRGDARGLIAIDSPEGSPHEPRRLPPPSVPEPAPSGRASEVVRTSDRTATSRPFRREETESVDVDADGGRRILQARGPF